MKKKQRKQPEGPPRGGMKEGPTRMDHTVTDARISVEEKIPRKCGCGCEKTTTLRELHIHMGKKKCGGGSLMQTCTARLRQVRQMESKAGLTTTVPMGPMLQRQSRRKGRRRKGCW